MKQKDHGISYFAAHITTIVSITLVLLIVGVIAIIGIAARNAGHHIREQVELSAVMQDSVSNEQAQKLATSLTAQPFALQTRLITKEEALKSWQQETGENLEEVFGVNPLSPEVSIVLKPEYTSKDSVAAISARLQQMPGVEGVAVPDTEAIGAMNSNIESLSIVLGIVAIALVCISFVLINNTVHLSIYSRRFIIHTMKLVGATNGFIRRPFVKNSLLSGIIASVVAAAVLWGAYEYLAAGAFAGIVSIVGRTEVALVTAGLFAIGALICAIAAMFATNRYLRMDYDELYKN